MKGRDSLKGVKFKDNISFVLQDSRDHMIKGFQSYTTYEFILILKVLLGLSVRSCYIFSSNFPSKVVILDLGNHGVVSHFILKSEGSLLE